MHRLCRKNSGRRQAGVAQRDVGVRAMVQTWHRLSEVLRKSCR